MNAYLLTFSIVTFLSVSLFLVLHRVFQLKRSNDTDERLYIGLGSMVPGFIACFLQLILLSHILWNENGALNLNVSNALLISTFIITLLCFVIALIIPIVQIIVVFIPINILIVIITIFFPSQAILLEPDSFALQAHILLSIMAYGVLAFGSLVAILFAIKDWQVKQHRFGILWRTMPSLLSLEILLFHVLNAGFALLTLGLVVGFIDLDNWFTHKVIFSVIAWCVFAVLLTGRHIWGWRGKKAVNLTLTGMVFLLLAFFGSKFVLEVLLA